MKRFIVPLITVFLFGGWSVMAQPASTGDDGILIRAKKNGKYGFVDKTGKEVIPFVYNYAEPFSDGLARVTNNQWKDGFIDKTGKLVIPYSFEFNSSHNDCFSEGLAFNVKDMHHYFIDKSGKQVFDCGEGVVFSPFSEGLVSVALYDLGDYTYGYMDKTGKLVIPYSYLSANPFSEGLACVENRNHNIVYIDKNGKVVITVTYDNAGSFSEGLALVSKYEDDRPKYGYIDKNGKLVIPLSFAWEGASSFSDGLARIMKEEKYGYIDKTGKIVIPCIYDEAEDFCGGVAVVSLNGEFGIIDKTGKITALGIYDDLGAWDHEGEEDEGI